MIQVLHSLKLNMAGWNIPKIQDVFPIEHGDFPVSHVTFGGVGDI